MVLFDSMYVSLICQMLDSVLDYNANTDCVRRIQIMLYGDADTIESTQDVGN